MRYRLSFFFCVLALWMGTISPVRAADRYPRQDGVDILHYIFRLTFTDANDEINGETTADVRFTKAGIAHLALDLTSLANGKGMTVSGVTLRGNAVRFTHQNDRLTLTLPAPSKAQERLQFVVRYRGVPGSGLRIGANKHGTRTFFSLNWPDLARQWLPTIDHPYEKATNEFVIIAPAHYQVVANGLLVEETDLGDGARLTHWKQSVPISSWLHAVAAAPFVARHFGYVNGISLQTWVFPQDREAGIATFEVPVRQAIEFFSEKIGPYPYEKLANVQAAGLNGGTEHASVIAYGENSVTMRPATNLVAHEIAHQWFGNSVTERDWDDVWLSEGFATYFTLLFTEHYSGRDAFVAGLVRSRGTVYTAEQRLPGKPVIHDNLSDMKQVLNQLVYQKGGWVLHMLRAQIGTQAFWTGIREYYHRYRDANVSTDELRTLMEEVSGQDLRWFFDQWLKRAPSPVVNGTWSYDAASKRIDIALTQTQGGAPYVLPIEIGIATPGAPIRIEKIEMKDTAQTFTIAADTAPATVTLDPNTWVLMQSSFQPR